MTLRPAMVLLVTACSLAIAAAICFSLGIW
jgi:hypothetical protein